MAGFFDGEGCVTISRKKGSHYKRGYTYQLVATITNSDKQVLEKFHKEFNGYFVKRESKNAWTLTFLCSKAINFLRAIYPYVLVKRKQSDIAFEFDKFIHSLGPHHHTEEQLNKKDEFALRIKRLNSNKGKWKKKSDDYGGKGGLDEARVNSMDEAEKSRLREHLIELRKFVGKQNRHFAFRTYSRSFLVKWLKGEQGVRGRDPPAESDGDVAGCDRHRARSSSRRKFRAGRMTRKREVDGFDSLSQNERSPPPNALPGRIVYEFMNLCNYVSMGSRWLMVTRGTLARGT